MRESNAAKRAALVADLDKRRSSFVEARVFLDGNEDRGSLCCNLPEHPGMQAIRDIVARVEATPGVSGVFVEIKEVMDEPDWPFSDCVLVCTNAAPEVIADWFEPLTPDEVNPASDIPHAPPSGQRWWSVWWD